MKTSATKTPWVAPETIGDAIKRLLDLARLVGADVTGYDSAVTPERCASEDWTAESGYAWATRIHGTATKDALRLCRSFVGSAGHSFGIHLDRLRAPPETLWVTETGVSFSFMDLLTPNYSPLREFGEWLEAAEDEAAAWRSSPAGRAEAARAAELLAPSPPPSSEPATPSRNQRCRRCNQPIDIADDEHAVEAGVYRCETCMTKPPAAPRRPMPMGPPLSEEDALASVKRALERLYPVHNLRLVLSASDEVKETVCAMYQSKGYEARAIPEGIYLHLDEDGKAAQMEIDEDDKRRWSDRAAQERHREFLRDEETRS